ncbi:MAG TPA: hypothetical protein PKC43_06090 [Phycisphaerales bacterium]|nr:hypothetical protein [Phycisphaerales bacterium]HMP37003.1 hypothetical protein [Phycisphaerales bacterium]
MRFVAGGGEVQVAESVEIGVTSKPERAKATTRGEDPLCRRNLAVLLDGRFGSDFITSPDGATRKPRGH